MGAGSIWHHKPWWCQPWSIVATGVGVVVGSLIWPARWWITLALGLAVSLWWLLFLVLVPAAWLREQEDTASPVSGSESLRIRPDSED